MPKEIPFHPFPKDKKEDREEEEEPCEYSLYIDIDNEYIGYRWTESGAINTNVRIPILWGATYQQAFYHSDYFGLPRPDYQQNASVLQLELWVKLSMKANLVIHAEVGPFIKPELVIEDHTLLAFNQKIIRWNLITICQMFGLEPKEPGNYPDFAISTFAFSWETGKTFPFYTRWVPAAYWPAGGIDEDPQEDRTSKEHPTYKGPRGGPAKYIRENEKSEVPLGKRLHFRLEFIPNHSTVRLDLTVRYTKPNLQVAATKQLAQVPVYLSNGLDIWHRTNELNQVSSIIVPVPSLVLGRYKPHQLLLSGLSRPTYQKMMTDCYGSNPTTPPPKKCRLCGCDKLETYCICTCACCW